MFLLHRAANVIFFFVSFNLENGCSSVYAVGHHHTHEHTDCNFNVGKYRFQITCNYFVYITGKVSQEELCSASDVCIRLRDQHNQNVCDTHKSGFHTFSLAEQNKLFLIDERRKPIFN